VNRRDFVVTASGLALGASQDARSRNTKREVLYNGIELPAAWPPRMGEPPREPITPPYLKSPPAFIPIDFGRQLLIDDFLIEHATLARTFHRPRPHARSPVLRPEKAWERGRGAGMAMVFSDGVWYDAEDRLFKMWYLGGAGSSVCHARSEDGIHWTRPELNVRKGTNITHPGPRDSATVWLDVDEKNPNRRWKLFRSHAEGGRFGLSVHFSRDGLSWGDRVLWTGSVGDRTTVFYNPFRKVWVYSNRHGWGRPRKRRYWETPDLLKGPMWKKIDEPPTWCGSDRVDPQREDLKVVPELYNLDCVAYESILLGLFSIWRGDKNIPPGRPKINEVCTGFSRDGFHWHRPDRRAFIGVSERAGDWNWGNVQSAGGCCLVVGDELYFYHSGRSGSPSGKSDRDRGGSTGLAVLRRDGFSSLNAGATEGWLTTRPVRFSGKYLFVNADARGGELVAEVLDDRGRVLPGLSRTDCIAVRADKTCQAITWKEGNLAPAVGKTVKFRFCLKRAKLFAFWVSRVASGASGGFIAAGGPGLRGNLDGA
jgi:hypothetical protein